MCDCLSYIHLLHLTPRGMTVTVSIDFDATAISVHRRGYYCAAGSSDGTCAIFNCSEGKLQHSRIIRP